MGITGEQGHVDMRMLKRHDYELDHARLPDPIVTIANGHGEVACRTKLLTIRELGHEGTWYGHVLPISR
jgi:hypothetical protein